MPEEPAPAPSAEEMQRAYNEAVCGGPVFIYIGSAGETPHQIVGRSFADIFYRSEPFRGGQGRAVENVRAVYDRFCEVNNIQQNLVELGWEEFLSVDALNQHKYSLG